MTPLISIVVAAHLARAVCGFSGRGFGANRSVGAEHAVGERNIPLSLQQSRRFVRGAAFSAMPLVATERPLFSFGGARYSDTRPAITWEDVSGRGMLGATCDPAKNAESQCGKGLVCTGGVCRQCTRDKECPSSHTCQKPWSGGSGMCVFEEVYAWQEVFTNPFEGLCTFLIFLGAALAAASGTGGGGMFVPLLLSFSSISADRTVPLSQCMILCGAVVNIAVFVSQRHPEFPDAPLIDYDCIVLLAPMIFLGVLLGVLINQMTPQWFLLLLLLASLGVALWRSAKKGMSQWRAEQLAPPDASMNSSRTMTPEPIRSQMAQYYEDIIELTNSKHRQVVGTMVIWMVILVSAFHGFGTCTTEFMVFLFLLAVLLVVASEVIRRYIVADQVYQAEAMGLHKRPSITSPVPWVDDVFLPLLGLSAGFLGGLLGLGGGIIMSPVLLEMGMHSTATQATTALLVLLSSSIATIQFAVLGQHVWHYAIWYSSVAVAGTILGQILCDRYVRKHKRYSFITLAIAGVLLASLLALLIVGTINVLEDIRNGAEMGFTTARLCAGSGPGIITVDAVPAQKLPSDLPQYAEADYPNWHEHQLS